jgi:hypothetical protein
MRDAARTTIALAVGEMHLRAESGAQMKSERLFVLPGMRRDRHFSTWRRSDAGRPAARRNMRLKADTRSNQASTFK